MYYLVDNNKKIVFGWSAKCGCTHIKILFRYLTTGINSTDETTIHSSYNKLPDNDYMLIMFIRNPYKRLVSGFLDKYETPNSDYKWDLKIPLNFYNFVNNLDILETHHFGLQTSERFVQKKAKIYDIENIDYVYIETLFGMKIPDNIKTYKGSHSRGGFILDKPIYNLEQKYYKMYNPTTQSFYNSEIQQLVYSYYKRDFDIFKSYGFNYTI